MVDQVIMGDPATGSLPAPVITRLATEMADPTSDVGASLSDTFDRARKNTVILFGTSLEAANGGPTDVLDPSSASYGSVLGWFNWANAFLLDQMVLVANAGVGGDTYAGMLARIDTDVLANDSDWVFMGGPVNDIIQGRTYAQIVADANSILDALKGRKIVILTATATDLYSTTEMKTVAAQINAWIRNLPRIRNAVAVVDAWNLVADKSTGYAATGMTRAGDTLHWSSSAAMRIGRAVATAITPMIEPAPPYHTFNGDPLSAVANPSMISGTGWASTINNGTVAFSADANFGGKVTLNITGATTATTEIIQYYESISGARFAAGDVVQATMRMKWSSYVPVGVAAAFIPILYLWQRSVDGSWAKQGDSMFSSSGQNVVQVGVPASGEIVIRTPKFTVQSPTSPVNAIYAYVGLAGAASAVVEISDFSLRKIV